MGKGKLAAPPPKLGSKFPIFILLGHQWTIGPNYHKTMLERKRPQTARSQSMRQKAHVSSGEISNVENKSKTLLEGGILDDFKQSKVKKNLPQKTKASKSSKIKNGSGAGSSGLLQVSFSKHQKLRDFTTLKFFTILYPFFINSRFGLEILRFNKFISYYFLSTPNLTQISHSGDGWLKITDHPILAN